MKSASKINLWLTMLVCVVLSAGLLVQSAAGTPTGRCTNLTNEGIEFFYPVSILATEANEWRTDLETIVDTSGMPAGSVVGLELEAVNLSTRYQCTEIAPGTNAIYSCNSLPAGSVISGIYVLIKPDLSITENTDFSLAIKQVTNGKQLFSTKDKIKFPPYPCGRNFLTRDFRALDNGILTYNTSEECTSEGKTVFFREQGVHNKDKYALVNIIPGDTIQANRIRIDIKPEVHFDYTLVLNFCDANDTDHVVYYYYTWDPVTHKASFTIDDSSLVGLSNSDLPLTLGGLYSYEDIPGDSGSTVHAGWFTDVTAKEKDLWGKDAFPEQVDFNIKFWYENTTGTLGYENSIFHFERNMNILFGPYCNSDAEAYVMTGVASQLLDPCKTGTALFTNISLTDSSGKGIKVAHDQTECDTQPYCTDVYSVDPPIHDYAVDHAIPKESKYYFVTRKCLDSSCSSYTTTNAYIYSLTVADALNKAKTYKGSSGNPTTFNMSLYDDVTGDRPFEIAGLSFAANEPGTYMVLGFVDPAQVKTGDLKHYAVKFFVQINKSDQLTTCSTLANNGYYRALWNDCLSHSETQLLGFEHIPDTEWAWINNTSNHDVNFPYVPEWSYLPQKLQIASLNCRFESLGEGGEPGRGICNPDNIMVPRHTRVTIVSGTMYLEAKPSVDEYRVAYAREETYNISHLFITVPIKECENVRRIPDTGISLRSPLKVKESADAATSYVFTGNSLRIPAIGLGMETPIPIVHVYYEEGSENLQWDLSTLGNYVGELEGGAYLPFSGNSALTGHYWSGGVFKNLENLNYEDEIIVYGNDGIKYTYKVVQKFLAQPEDVYEMFQQIGDRSLTLVTCENYNLNTDKYERRQLIRATIDHMEPYEEIW